MERCVTLLSTIEEKCYEEARLNYSHNIIFPSRIWRFPIPWFVDFTHLIAHNHRGIAIQEYVHHVRKRAKGGIMQRCHSKLNERISWTCKIRKSVRRWFEASVQQKPERELTSSCTSRSALWLTRTRVHACIALCVERWSALNPYYRNVITWPKNDISIALYLSSLFILSLSLFSLLYSPFLSPPLLNIFYIFCSLPSYIELHIVFVIKRFKSRNSISAHQVQTLSRQFIFWSLWRHSTHSSTCALRTALWSAKLESGSFHQKRR